MKRVPASMMTAPEGGVRADAGDEQALPVSLRHVRAQPLRIHVIVVPAANWSTPDLSGLGESSHVWLSHWMRQWQMHEEHARHLDFLLNLQGHDLGLLCSFT